MVIPPTKDDGTGSVNKPKRGASPSNHNASTTIKRNPRHPTTTSSSTSSSSEKPVPNYLRSTASSRTEPPKDVRKKTPPSSEATAKKPVLTRRSSFDRSPVPSHLQKILSPASRERSLNIRSSSFSGKSGILYRPVSERTSTGHSKAPKAISKPQQANNLGGRSVAKKSGPAASASSSLSTKKKENLSNASNVVDASNKDNPGTCSVLDNNKSPPKEDMEEIGEPVDMESKNVVAQEDSDVFNEDHRIAHSENNVNNTDKEETHAEDNVVSAAEEDEKNSLAAAETQTEEVQKEKDREETVSDNLKGEDEEVEVADGVAAGEAEDRKEDERVVGGVDELQDEKEARDVVEETGDPAITSGEKQSEEEQGNEEEEEEEEKQTAEKTIAKQRSHKAVHPGKKEVAQANNDVIEETASKLMEKRKNKVKALVGAFETVISLQEPEA